MTEPCSVVTQALIVRGAVQVGDIVFVQGCGTIGLISAMVAKAIGAEKVIISGTEADKDVRLPIAKELGIDFVININETDLKSKVMEITDGKV